MSNLEKRSTLPNKRVIFRDDVSIRCFEAESERQSLSDDVELESQQQQQQQQKTMTTTTTDGQERRCPQSRLGEMNRQIDLHLHLHQQQQQQLSAAEAGIQRRKPPTFSSVPLLPEENMLQFKIVRDRHPRQLLLQFSVVVGPMYGPKGVMVKANVAGTKIRVLACSKNPVKSSDGQSIKTEYSKTFSLPVAVDPDRVTARVDSLGLLKVEAPINMKCFSFRDDDNNDNNNNNNND